MAYNFTAIEKKWQQHWLDNKSFRTLEPSEAGSMPPAYVLDMFPYPSGYGLHVGHPEGYVATDIVSRYLRMTGHNVLHPMGWDAFGLPAEQFAIKNNVHPRVTTERNIVTFRRQMQILGLSYDWDREVDTTDPKYYRWTQWIFLRLFNSYFDPIDQKAKPIAHLYHELQNDNYLIAPDSTVVISPVHEGMEPLSGEVHLERRWRELTPEEQQDLIDAQRLAYMDDVPVNWCQGLGTVLANEEVIDGKSEVGGFPVERRPMRQWMLRITAYAQRLIDDLKLLDWPDSLREMQRNWIGRSEGAHVDFEIEPGDAAGGELGVTVFTTRPDTLYGATYLVLAPEHPLVDQITAAAQKPAVDEYRRAVAGRSERDRIADTREKTGVLTGALAVNPVNDERIPVYVADYVVMGYGTGAIMAVPGHDQRDYEFARKFGLPIRTVVRPAEGLPPTDRAFEADGIAVNSQLIDGLPTDQAKQRMTEVLRAEGTGRRSVQYKLRDWLFARQRYWGEPFPILLDEQGRAYPLDEDELPLVLPEMEDYKPTGTPEPPLSKALDWLRVERNGKLFTRENIVMPQWAGSCWYYLRFIDPHNEACFVDPVKERYWMPVGLYVGGVEHAVLHLLYARFWHKVLFDLGHVSTPEPFQRLVNQGVILGEMEFHAFRTRDEGYVSADELTDIHEEVVSEGPAMVGTHRSTGEKHVGHRVEGDLVEKRGTQYVLKEKPAIAVDARAFKMSKSRGNVVTPDEIVGDHGADAFRLYEMYLGPLEAQKPWSTRDIVGQTRFLNAVWRHLVGDEESGKQAKVVDAPIPEAIERMMHRTIKKVGEDIQGLRFNTAIAELIKLNNEMGRLSEVPRVLAETFVLLLAPLAPHIAEEIWQRLGHDQSLARHPWPKHDPGKLEESTMELPVQVNGKLRDRITVPADADEQQILQAAVAAKGVEPWLAGKTIRKRLYVAKRLVNIVVG
jgi:leucyl-tRNA synthetase